MQTLILELPFSGVRSFSAPLPRSAEILNVLPQPSAPPVVVVRFDPDAVSDKVVYQFTAAMAGDVVDEKATYVASVPCAMRSDGEPVPVLLHVFYRRGEVSVV